MGANESTLRTTAVLLVLWRRNKLSEAQIDFFQTKEAEKFYNKNKNKVERYACDLYGNEILDLINKNDILNMDPIVNDVFEYGCSDYRSPLLYQAVQKMIEQNNAVKYIKYFKKLAGYLTYDNIIDAVSRGDLKVYEEIKEPVSRLPGEEGILDPLRDPLSKGIIITTTRLSKESLALASIMIGILSLEKDNTTERLTILKDLIEYIRQIKFMKKADLNNSLNEMGKFLAQGDLLAWNPELVNAIKSEGFIFPDVKTGIDQARLYEKYFAKILQRYPKIGLLQRLIY